MAAQLFLTEEQRKEFKRQFKLKDKNGDNSISAEELGEVMKSIGKNYTKEELEKMISEVDKDNNGTMELSEGLMQLASKWSLKTSQYIRGFDDMDKDGNGFLSADELRQAMSACTDPPMTEEEIDGIIKKADLNKDGKVDREEFVKLIKSSY